MLCCPSTRLVISHSPVRSVQRLILRPTPSRAFGLGKKTPVSNTRRLLHLFWTRRNDRYIRLTLQDGRERVLQETVLAPEGRRADECCSVDAEGVSVPHYPRHYPLLPLGLLLRCVAFNQGLRFKRGVADVSLLGLLDTLNKHFQDTLGITRARSSGLQAAYFGYVFCPGEQWWDMRQRTVQKPTGRCSITASRR